MLRADRSFASVSVPPLHDVFLCDCLFRCLWDNVLGHAKSFILAQLGLYCSFAAVSQKNLPFFSLQNWKRRENQKGPHKFRAFQGQRSQFVTNSARSHQRSLLKKAILKIGLRQHTLPVVALITVVAWLRRPCRQLYPFRFSDPIGSSTKASRHSRERLTQRDASRRTYLWQTLPPLRRLARNGITFAVKRLEWKISAGASQCLFATQNTYEYNVNSRHALL